MYLLIFCNLDTADRESFVSTAERSCCACDVELIRVQLDHQSNLAANEFTLCLGCVKLVECIECVECAESI